MVDPDFSASSIGDPGSSASPIGDPGSSSSSITFDQVPSFLSRDPAKTVSKPEKIRDVNQACILEPRSALAAGSCNRTWQSPYTEHQSVVLTQCNRTSSSVYSKTQNLLLS